MPRCHDDLRRALLVFGVDIRTQLAEVLVLLIRSASREGRRRLEARDVVEEAVHRELAYLIERCFEGLGLDRPVILDDYGHGQILVVKVL